MLLHLVLFSLFMVIDSSYTNEENVVKKVLSEKDLQQVQDHYTNYPYPHYNPANDMSGGHVIFAEGQMTALNHYIYHGKGDLGRTRTFRILIAGGGTGNGIFHYSNAFMGRNISIVYLDFSAKSLEIAKARADKYLMHNNNITFIHSSIYNIPDLHLGTFDFIDCYGVLHHLPDPQEGLRVLKGSLAEDGGMMLMLYAYHGRQGTYSMQESQRILSANKSFSLQEEVRRGRVLFNNHNKFSRAFYAGLPSEAYTDEGFYDLYLHKKDKAFVLPELYEYIEDKGGLKIIYFIDNHFRESINECPTHLKKLSLRKRHAVNEMLFGLTKKHGIYVGRSSKSEASVDDLENIPYFIVDNVTLLVHSSSTKKKTVLKVFTDEKHILPRRIRIPISKYTNIFLKLIYRESMPMKELINYVLSTSKKKDLKTQRSKITKDLKATLKALILHNMLLLRHKSLPPFPIMSTQTKILSVTLLNT